MKKILAAFLLLALTTGAGSRLFRPWFLHWDDPNPVGFVAAYEIWKIDGTNETLLATVPTNSWRIELPPGEHSVAVVAVGTNTMTSPQSESINLATVLAVVRLRVEQ